MFILDTSAVFHTSATICFIYVPFKPTIFILDTPQTRHAQRLAGSRPRRWITHQAFSTEILAGRTIVELGR